MKELPVLKKNDIVQVVIEDLGNDGQGIGRVQGFTLFVKGAVTGDKAEVLILKVKKSFGYAKTLKIIESSPFRVEPLCPIAMKCGGCQLQHISYEKQLEYKKDKVLNCIQRIGGISDVQVESVVGMENPYYYRNKAQFPVGRDHDGAVVTGFYAAHTHSIIDTKRCDIQPEISNVVINAVREFLIDENISIYDEKEHKGLVRHVLIRLGVTTGEVMVCLVVNGDSFDKAPALLNKLLDVFFDQKFYKLKCICLNKNTENTNVIMGDTVISLFGDPYIMDYIGDVKYRISPLSFFQVNPYQTVKLYDQVLSYAELSGEEIVWDLYCGIGTISLYLAKQAKFVYGVEIVPKAIDDAVVNAKLNGIENVEFFLGAAEEVLPLKYQEDADMKADVVVLDPPRKGCDEKLLETVVKIEPEKIVYVSCDPATLARDLKYLVGEGYELKRLSVVDQFAMTVHCEVCVEVCRK